MAPTSITGLQIPTADGGRISLPDPNHKVHLQFRRFAGCPICNLHLRSFVRRHSELRAASVREVVFFHSPADELLPHVADLPFDAVADPDRHYYRQFGVESSPRALLDPRAWRSIVVGMSLALTGRFRVPEFRQPTGRLGLPADFLIDTDGRVIAEKYGCHADDQWSVDELLRYARTAGGPVS
ncbi:peroxiredoxin-like family protein [Mycolicibacterium vaccae]|uniref:peroxiredoxin-like family protein n=1 Tax=Mycolicibacterium vaccae TaxID=1810 RepID=UPI003CECED5F